MGGAELRGLGRAIVESVDAATLCFPLIEDPHAVVDIEEIMALPTVDGFQMGAGDLSLTSGRGAHKATEADSADAQRCVDAAVAADKPWLYPAWTDRDRKWALEQQASMILLSSRYNEMFGAVHKLRESSKYCAPAFSKRARRTPSAPG